MLAKQMEKERDLYDPETASNLPGNPCFQLHLHEGSECSHSKIFTCLLPYKAVDLVIWEFCVRDLFARFAFWVCLAAAGLPQALMACSSVVEVPLRETPLAACVVWHQ